MTDRNCIFCKIVKKEITSEILYQDEDITAFKDNNPQAPIHILIIPNKHITSIAHLENADQAVMGKILLVIQKLSEELNIAETGFRTVVNTGTHGQQTVFHIHFHLIGGRQMNWPPG